MVKQADKRRVITGVGILSSIGVDKNVYWKALEEGFAGTKLITLFDVSRFNVKYANQISEFDSKEILGKLGLIDLDRATILLSSAMKFAIEDAQLVINESNAHQIGISVGTTFGSLNSLSEFDKNCLVNGPKFVNPSRFPNTVINSPASRAAIRFGIKGINTTISTGFCAGADALDYALHNMQLNRIDKIFVGAVEDLCLQTFLGAYQLRYLSGIDGKIKPVSRPFDRNRDGMVLGEGAAVVLLETLESALNRKAKIYAEVVSVGSCFDPKGFYKHNGSFWGMINAMNMALVEGNLQNKDIDCIFVNANSMKNSDVLESKAIKEVFGYFSNQVPVTAVKSMIGETMSAAGIMNIVAALGSFEQKFIPPIANYQISDEGCNLNLVLRTIRNKPLNHVMINCFDPRGAATTLILKKFYMD